MSQLCESNIEEFAVELFEQLGYKYFYGPDIAPDGEMMLRESLEEVVLKDALRSAVYRINGELPKEVCDEPDFQMFT